MAIEKKRKTNHQTGWHKPIVNPTQNAKADGHKDFCDRCLGAHDLICPETGTNHPSKNCTL